MPVMKLNSLSANGKESRIELLPFPLSPFWKDGNMEQGEPLNTNQIDSQKKLVQKIVFPSKTPAPPPRLQP